MTVLVSHPTGNANVRHLAQALAEAGWLEAVVTGLAFGPDPAATVPGWPLLPPRLQRELMRRRWPTAVAPHLQPHPLADLLRLAVMRSGLFRGTALPGRLVDWQYRGHDRHVAARHLSGRTASPLTTVLAYEDGGAATLQAARRRGLRTILELPTLHHRSVQRWHRQEALRHPEYAPLLPALHEPRWKQRRKEAELAAADLIFVPSQLVWRSCVEAGIEPERLRVIPYGAPNPPAAPAEALDEASPLVLYVGRVTPSKGIHDLVEAWRQLPRAEPWKRARLWIVGAMDYPLAWQRSLPATVRCLGSLPQSELAHVFRRAWLLVMPSLIDGQPMVCLEAMAAGLPVLITDRCGVQELIAPGVNGWITPAADPDSLAALLTTLLTDPDLCHRAGLAARATAAAHSWDHYHQSLIATLRPLLPG